MIIIFLLISFIVIYAKYNPVPNKDAVIVVDNARFTILTSNIIRIEYSNLSQPKFHDEPSFAVLNRYLPVPRFNTSKNSTTFTVETSDLSLYYLMNHEITKDSLSIELKIKPFTRWNYGQYNNNSLHGTLRTLDYMSYAPDMKCKGPSWKYDDHCEEGLISLDGWSIIDDSQSVRLDNDEWQYPTEPLQDSLDGSYIDIYFFGHGYNFQQALNDFIKLSGPPPVPPRYALGVHYSRWYGYTDQEELEIVQNYFENGNIPLDVLVIDMDWHKTFPRGVDPNPHHINITGWTGFSWDTKMFNNPSTFLKYLEKRGISVSLNLHPGAGIQFYEDVYKEMANAAGIDPSTDQTVPFNITGKEFARNFYNIVIKPLNNQGIKFWWIDWQQGESTNITHLNPTILTNHLWFTYPDRWINDERPWILGRWGGYGNHRYPIGFSGDAATNWEMLKFEIYFTYTAANVGYQWGNDLGGFEDSIEENLYIRWLQFGLFSPSFRPHCNKDYTIFRDPWRFDYITNKYAKRLYWQRERFVPYLEKYYVKGYYTGLQPVHGMYYHYPIDLVIYDYESQYMFGDDILVSPIYSKPIDYIVSITHHEAYLPSGSWTGYFNGIIYPGEHALSENYLINEIPVFVRSGSIIPLNTIRRPLGNSHIQMDTLMLQTFLGDITDNTTFESYIIDTDGKTNGFINGEILNTTIKTSITNNGNNVNIEMKYGSGNGYPDLPKSRNYIISIHSVYPPKSVTVNNKAIPYSPYSAPNEHYEGDKWDELSWSYTINNLVLFIYIPNIGIKDVLSVSVVFEHRIDDYIYSGLLNGINRAKICKDLLDQYFGKIYVEDYPSVLKISGLGSLYLGNSTYQNIRTTLELLRTYKQSGLEELGKITDKTLEADVTRCVKLINDIIIW